MGAPAALLAVGSGLSAYAAIDKANAESEQALKEAQSKHLQAEELKNSGFRDEQTLQQQAHLLEGKQIAGRAELGASMDSGGLLKLEQTAAMVRQQLMDIRRKTLFNVGQLERGAAVYESLAASTLRGGYYNAGASILTGAGSYAKSSGAFSGNNGQTQQLTSGSEVV